MRNADWETELHNLKSSFNISSKYRQENNTTLLLTNLVADKSLSQ